MHNRYLQAVIPHCLTACTCWITRRVNRFQNFCLDWRGTVTQELLPSWLLLIAVYRFSTKASESSASSGTTVFWKNLGAISALFLIVSDLKYWRYKQNWRCPPLILDTYLPTIGLEDDCTDSCFSPLSHLACTVVSQELKGIVQRKLTGAKNKPKR